MRSVDLLQDDETIFGATVTRTLYMVYHENLKLLNTMIADQGTAYWIKYCTTLKSVLEKEGYSIKFLKSDNGYFDEFFVDLLKLLTDNKSSAIHGFVTKILSVAKSSQVLRAADIYRQSHFEGTRKIVLTDLLGVKHSDGLKAWSILPLYMRAVGSLLKILELWLLATPAHQIKWNIPHSWTDQSFFATCGKYEHYLKVTWGVELTKLLNVDNVIVWLGYNGNFSSKDNVTASVISCPASLFGKSIKETIRKSIRNQNDQTIVINGRPENELGKFHSYRLNVDFPRNMEIFFCPCGSRLLYQVANYRELYLVHDSEAFHPYSQFMILYWNSIFNPHQWEIIDSAFEDAALIPKSSHKWRKCVDARDIYMYHIMFSIPPTNEVRTAIRTDSRFHNLSAVNTTWDSPDVIVRLLWNMPLCLNWLEILLLRIYEFEYYFLPFVHSTVMDKVVPIVRNIFVEQCKAGRFLVRAALIVAEYIYMNEETIPGRCHDARCALKFALSMLIPKMNFFDGPAYQILESIIRESYSEEEMKDDKNYFTVEDRVFLSADTSGGSFIPDCITEFRSDRRSIHYYLPHLENGPTAQESLKFYSKALKLLRTYEKHTNHDCSQNQCKHQTEHFYDYDMELFEKACWGGFHSVCSDMLDDAEALIQKTIDFLKGDWMSNSCPVSFKITKDVKQKLDSMGLVVEEDMFLNVIAHLGKVCLVCASILGITRPGEVTNKPDQILLTRLLLAECRATLADSASRFIHSIIALGYSGYKCRPCSRVFSDIKDAFKTRGLKQVNLVEVSKLLPTTDGYHMDTSSLPPLQVPSWNNADDKDSLTSRLNIFCDEMFKFRYRLLHEIFDKQFANCERTSKKHETFNNITFKYLDIVEYRFVEEMAALQTALRIDKTDEVILTRLATLLEFRAQWLLKEFSDWSTRKLSKATQEAPYVVTCENVTSIFLQTTAVLVSLQSIFRVYLSPDPTLHLVSQGTVDMLVEKQVTYFLAIYKHGARLKTDKSMDTYYQTIEHLGIEYISQLHDHCVTVWKIPQLCSNPTKKVTLHSRLHAEQIYSALLHFFLFTSYGVLLKRREKLDMKNFLGEMTSEFIKTGVLLRSAALNRDVNWIEICKQLQEKYRLISSSVLSSANHYCGKMSESGLHGHLNSLHWKGGQIKTYLPLFLSYIGKASEDHLSCIKLNEFISEVPSENQNNEEAEESSEDNDEKQDVCDDLSTDYSTCHTTVTKSSRSYIDENDDVIVEQTIIKSTKHIENCNCYIPPWMKSHTEEYETVEIVENSEFEKLEREARQKKKENAVRQ